MAFRKSRAHLSSGHRAQRRTALRPRWLLLSLGVVVVSGAVWLAVTGLLARHELSAMRTDLSQLRQAISTGDVAGARSSASDLARHAHRAHSLTTGPAWWVAGEIPAVGEPARTVRGISASANALGITMVPKLVHVAGAIYPTPIVMKNHTLDISALVRATPDLTSALADARRQQHSLAHLPDHTWLGPINSGAVATNAEMTSLVGYLDTLDRAARAGPVLLGYQTPQRYFIAFQNEAEARGTGGLPGAFAIVVASHGKLTFTHFGSDSELLHVTTGLDFGPAYNEAWHDYEPTKLYQNSDVDPDFTYAARTWAAMWEKKSGQHVNGAVAVDPTALSYFLAVTGPAAMPDGSRISAQNIVALTQSVVYRKFDDQAKRKVYLLAIARAAEQRVLSGSGNAVALFRAARLAGSQRRLLLWTDDAPTEAFLSGSAIGGTIAKTDGPYGYPVVVNYGANKLDYYLESTVTWASAGCATLRNVTVTITLTNTAPAAGLPTYVTQRQDDPGYRVAPGDNRVLLYYVGSTRGSLTRITIGGRAGAVQSGSAGDHPTYATLVELPRGRATTVVLTLREPASLLAPVLVRQPMVHPVIASAHTETCSKAS